MEKWIKGYEGLYKITDRGTVIRYYKSGATKEHIGSQNASGYISIALCKEGESKTLLMHRLVAEYFIPNADTDKTLVDHADEDKTNNRVSNLRWCSPKENMEFYCTKDGRRHHIELAKARKKKLKQYESMIIGKKKEIKELEVKVRAKEKELDKKEKLLVEQEDRLKKQEQVIKEFIEKEELRLDKGSSYDGYLDTTGVKFKSIDEMVNTTGKPIKVDGVEFKSCGSAASYIVKKELMAGYSRNKGTISKELRRYLQGKRPSWKMYGKYLVS